MESLTAPRYHFAKLIDFFLLSDKKRKIREEIAMVGPRFEVVSLKNFGWIILLREESDLKRRGRPGHVAFYLEDFSYSEVTEPALYTSEDAAANIFRARLCKLNKAVG